MLLAFAKKHHFEVLRLVTNYVTDSNFQLNSPHGDGRDGHDGLHGGFDGGFHGFGGVGFVVD